MDPQATSGTRSATSATPSEQTLRPHQQRILDANPKRAFLVHQMRTGKSLIAELWSKHPDRNGNVYVICTKKNKQEWSRRCPHATVWSKEEFKKHVNKVFDPTAIVVDEFHHFCSPLYIAKKRSQQAEALYMVLKQYPTVDRLFLTGTPLTNDPASIHTAITFLGVEYKWATFRDEFYELKRMPFIPRPAYFPIKDWRQKANVLLERYADIVSLKDCVSFMPESTDEIVSVKTAPRIYEEDEEYHWTKDHKSEQVGKAEVIKDIGDGYRKLIVVCHYTEQIDELAVALKNHKPVFVMDGRTKNQEAVIKEAQAISDCYFIVQAAMGEGWDGWMFDAMIFTSMPHRVLFHTQMKARLDTAEVAHMKPKLYYYLHGGPWDQKIHKSIMAGEDWNPHR